MSSASSASSWPSMPAASARAGGWEVFTHGGRRATGLDALSWAVECTRLGAGEILVTSMDRDGTEAGYDLELTRRIADSVRVPVIASGGVGELEHLVEGALEGHADGLLAASIFHFGRHTIARGEREARFVRRQRPAARLLSGLRRPHADVQARRGPLEGRPRPPRGCRPGRRRSPGNGFPPGGARAGVPGRS